MLSKISWSWPDFLNASPAGAGWYQAWTGARAETLTEAGKGAAAFGLSILSERSVAALVGLAFEAAYRRLAPNCLKGLIGTEQAHGKFGEKIHLLFQIDISAQRKLTHRCRSRNFHP
jgi:hypothetical protein